MYDIYSDQKVMAQTTVSRSGLNTKPNEAETNCNRKLGVATTLIAIFLLAGNGYFAKGLVADTLALTFLRSVIAAFAIYLFVKIKGQSISLESRRDFIICGLACFLLGVHWLCFFYSMRISTVALGMTMLYTYPIITLWLEALILKKKVHTLSLIHISEPTRPY